MNLDHQASWEAFDVGQVVIIARIYLSTLKPLSLTSASILKLWNDPEIS